MDKEIKELDFKYWVVKKEDIETLPCDSDRELFSQILDSVREHRAKRGKEPTPRYLVLKLDDEIDTEHFWRCMNFYVHKFKKVKVKDIAVDLVNAILKAKRE